MQNDSQLNITDCKNAYDFLLRETVLEDIFVYLLAKNTNKLLPSIKNLKSILNKIRNIKDDWRFNLLELLVNSVLKHGYVQGDLILNLKDYEQEFINKYKDRVLTEEELLDYEEKINTYITGLRLLIEGNSLAKAISFQFGNTTTINDVLNIFKQVNTRITEILIDNKTRDTTEIHFDLNNINSIVTGHFENEKKRLTFNTLPFLDQYNLIQTGRLILFGAPTNHGKTTMLSSIATSAYTNCGVMSDTIRDLLQIPQEYKLGIVFLTLEESKHDIQKRVLSNLLEIPLDTISDIREDVLLDALKNKMSFIKDIILCIKYLPAMVSNLSDVYLYLEKLKTHHKIWPIMVIIDYLDKIQTTIDTTDEYRIKLLAATTELRNIAIMYNIPVITATQLNRESLKGKSTASLSLDKIAEAYSKTWEADAVILFKLLNKTDNDTNYLAVTVPKSRMSARVSEPIIIDAKLNMSKIIGQIVGKLEEDNDEHEEKIISDDNKTLLL